jgi:hypothetical protein
MSNFVKIGGTYMNMDNVCAMFQERSGGVCVFYGTSTHHSFSGSAAGALIMWLDEHSDPLDAYVELIESQERDE